MTRAAARLFLVLMAVGISASCAPRHPVTQIPASDRQNIVLIITDDQRWDTLWAMPILKEKLVERGVTYTNAFVTTPLCCPSRASLLSGGYYPHDVGVLTNTLPNGGAEKDWDDSVTLGTMLQSAGYRTALIGKYLNNYEQIAPYVPPGWDHWAASGIIDQFFNYEVVIGSSGSQSTRGHITRQSQYVTDFQRDQAVEFIKTRADRPFFLYLSTSAPHGPATPAPGDGELFATFTPSSGTVLEDDRRDKPRWVQEQFTAPGVMQEFAQDQLESLQAVDRAVGAVVDAVADIGQLDNTVFIFMSDNGFSWGSHGTKGKGSPYEESIRVPFVLTVAGAAAGKDERLVVANLDAAATVLDVAGITSDTQGESLLPGGVDSNGPDRDHILIENLTRTTDALLNGPKWSGIRTAEWKYVEHPTGEKELYDLKSDPSELQSLHLDLDKAPVIAELSDLLREERGLAVTSPETPDSLPPVDVGKDFEYQLTAWGGTLPYTWRIAAGNRLPDGLVLDPLTGVISGKAITAGRHVFDIQVTDASVSPHHGGPQRYIATLAIQVARPVSK